MGQFPASLRVPITSPSLEGAAPSHLATQTGGKGGKGRGKRGRKEGGRGKRVGAEKD